MGRLDEVRRRIRELRGFRSQREIAKLANIDISTLSRVERGVIEPSISTLEALAPALGTSFSALIAYEDATAGPTEAEDLAQIADPLEALSKQLATLRRELRKEIADTNERIAKGLEAVRQQPAAVKPQKGRRR